MIHQKPNVKHEHRTALDDEVATAERLALDPPRADHRRDELTLLAARER